MMLSILRVAVLAGLTSVVGLGESWSGALVDAKCYASRQRNVNMFEPYVSRDIRGDVRYCSPNSKTKGFGIVRQDGSIVNFDSSGNQRGVELMRTASRQASYIVTVTGELARSEIKVKSISLAQ